MNKMEIALLNRRFDKVIYKEAYKYGRMLLTLLVLYMLVFNFKPEMTCASILLLVGGLFLLITYPKW